VSPNRVERVDQLTAGRDEARLCSTGLVSRDGTPRRALAQSWRADAPERERNAQATRAAIEEWQVESVEVVILDHVGINRLHARHEPAYEIRFRRVIRAVRGRPDAAVTIYRAAPPGTSAINSGDWVTTSRAYAAVHGRHATDPAQDWPVISMQVPVRDVYWGGNDFAEFGYWPGVEDRS